MSTARSSDTVGMVMGWLNSIFGLSLPTTAPATWPGFLTRLWSMLVPPPLPRPDAPLPWIIEVDGNFEGLFPEGSTLEVKAAIVVAHITGSPPSGAGSALSTFIPFPWTRKEKR